MITYLDAKKYIDAGYPVFPVSITWNEKDQKFDKKPAVESWKKYQDQLPTDIELHAWFDTGTHNGLGIPTGKFSEIVILDIEAEFVGECREKWLSPLTSRTISGGEHRAFRYEGGLKNTVKIGGKPMDLRAEGGFFVAPPSTCGDKKYEWINQAEKTNLPTLPEEIKELLKTRIVSDFGEPFDITTALNKEIGSRDDTINKLAWSLANKYPPDEAWEVIRAVNRTYKPPLDENVVQDKLNRAFMNILEWSEAKEVTPEISLQEDNFETMRDEAFYGLAGEIVRIIEPHSEADPVALLASLLTGFGSIIGDHSFIQVEADKHYGRLFCTIAGDTSKARKGTSWGHIKRLLGLVDPSWEAKPQTGLSSGEGLIWAVRDQIVKQQPRKEGGHIVGYEEIIEDSGIDDKRLLVVESELASVLQNINREGNNLSAVIRNAWDNGNLQTLTKNSPAKATGAHISIIAHITQDELVKYLTETERLNGFANRFIFLFSKRSKELPNGGNIKSVNLQPLIQKLEAAIRFAQVDQEVFRDAETEIAWAKAYHELSRGRPGLVGSLTARSEAQVLRLSLIYALLDMSPVIKAVHLAAALAFWQYAEESVLRIFNLKSGDPLADKVFDLLRENPDGLRRSQILDAFNRHPSSNRLSEALNLLTNLQWVEKRIENTDGRPAEIWKVKEKAREKREKQFYSAKGGLSSLNSQLFQEQIITIAEGSEKLENPIQLSTEPATIIVPNLPGLDNLSINDLKTLQVERAQWFESCPAGLRTSREFDEVMAQQREVATKIYQLEKNSTLDENNGGVHE